jgi:hypothetical protein
VPENTVLDSGRSADGEITSIKGTVERFLPRDLVHSVQQDGRGYPCEMEAEPVWLTSKIDKSNWAKKDCNFPFKILVTGIPCSCYDLEFDQKKKGLFSFIGDGGRTIVPPANLQAGSDWTDDTFEYGKIRGSALRTPGGRKKVVDYMKVLPMQCFPKERYGPAYRTYSFLDAPGLEWQLGTIHRVGRGRYRIMGIEWNVQFQHYLFCGGKRVWSVTFALTGKYTKQQDTRKINILK